jgi:hypothetical protein
MDHIHGRVRIYVDNCYRPVNMHYDHLLFINEHLWYFTLKFQKIFHLLQEKFKETNLVLLFNFTFYVFIGL